MEGLLKTVANILMNSKNAVVLTGAGISAESGIPTFRGKNGLWKKYKPEDLATPFAFQRNPRLVWEWYAWRMDLISRAKPNPAHITLAEMEKEGIIKAVITQNVDGLHFRAGSKNVIELHGNIWRVKCVNCNWKTVLNSPPSRIPPTCEKCGGLMRPDVVWFHEPLPREALHGAFKLAAQSDVMLIIGTSGVVQPAASLPLVTREHGGILIEINVTDTPLTPICQYTFRGKAGEILPKIHKRLKNTD